MNDSDLEKAVNDSGFPMQLGLKHLVEAAGSRWRVALTEHPWRDPLTDDDKFLDLVLRAGGDEVMAIECKRSRDTDWIFLREPTRQAANNGRRVARAWVNVVNVEKENSFKIGAWRDILPNPRSPIGQYCVIRKNNQRTQELLERSAAEIVRATEALASQDFRVSWTQKKQLRCIYVPVIVTTARLFICDVDPSKFLTTEGEIPDHEFTRCGMVRFSKTFDTPADFASATNLEEIAKQAERTVLVVEAGYFTTFLREWELEVDLDLGKDLYG